MLLRRLGELQSHTGLIGQVAVFIVKRLLWPLMGRASFPANSSASTAGRTLSQRQKILSKVLTEIIKSDERRLNTDRGGSVTKGPTLGACDALCRMVPAGYLV